MGKMMTLTPNIRHLWGLCSHGIIGGSIVKSEAIPWCTTHDRQAIVENDEASFVVEECWQVVWTDELGGDYELCRISTGGPDHDWWKDV